LLKIETSVHKQDMFKTAGLICLFTCSALQAAGCHSKRDWIAELRAGGFFPTSSTIQKIFGHGWIEGEAEFTYRFIGHWGVWGNAGYSFNKNGHVKFHHDAHIQLIPVSAGLKYIFCSHKIRPYLGIGPCYTFIHLKNYSPLTRQRSYKNRFGFAAKSGIYFYLPRHWAIDLFLDYYFQHVHFQRTKADVSGFRAGLGLGYRF
jgi:outer membrane protein W